MSLILSDLHMQELESLEMAKRILKEEITNVFLPVLV
jgi:CheY-like chemotaxis protein